MPPTLLTCIDVGKKKRGEREESGEIGARFCGGSDKPAAADHSAGSLLSKFGRHGLSAYTNEQNIKAIIQTFYKVNAHHDTHI